MRNRPIRLLQKIPKPAYNVLRFIKIVLVGPRRGRAFKRSTYDRPVPTPIPAPTPCETATFEGESTAQRIDFILYYERWQRELFGIQLLNAELQNRGYRTEICSKPGSYPGEGRLSTASFFTLPEVVVFPWVYKNDEVQFARWFPNHPHKIVNLQSEQIYSDYSRHADWFRIRDEAQKAYSVAWGAQSRKIYLKWRVTPEHIWKCGSIHLDLASKKFDSLYFSRDELAAMYGLDVDKMWTVYISSFSYTTLT
jgi:hypothetical protein